MTGDAAIGTSIKANGGRIYFEVRGHGEPVLLLHGFSGAGADWAPSLLRFGQGFQLIMPDLRGHGKSGTLTSQFRHADAAADMFALLDHLKLTTFKGVGISAGGNVLLHMATKQPERVRAMVIVSATPYFPEEARVIQRNFAQNVPEQMWEMWRKKHPGGDAQIKALLDSTTGFADSHDDMNFTPEDLKKDSSSHAHRARRPRSHVSRTTFGGHGEGDPSFRALGHSQLRARARHRRKVAGVHQDSCRVPAGRLTAV